MKVKEQRPNQSAGPRDAGSGSKINAVRLGSNFIGSVSGLSFKNMYACQVRVRSDSGRVWIL